MNNRRILGEGCMARSAGNTKSFSLFKLIEWPLIGFFTVLKPFTLIISLISLACYYIVYFSFYPFRTAYRIISDSVFKIYKNQGEKRIELKEIAPYESVNLVVDEEETSEPVVAVPAASFKESTLKKAWGNSYFMRKQREKEVKTRDQLIKAMQEESRSDKPITFQYAAVGPDGKKEVNTFIAFSKMEVYAYLENERYKVLKIETSPLLEFLYGPKSINSGKMKTKDIIFWLTQLSTYIKSGIPLTDAMRILGKQMHKDKKKKRVFDSIIYYLTLGETFSSALEKQINTFPALLINMIKAAEATGELEETLDDMAAYYTDVEETRKQMVSAMSYPLIIMIFSIGVVAFILLYVIPQFSSVYDQAGASLNPFTQFVLNASVFLKANFTYLVLFTIIAILGITLAYKKVKAFRYVMQKIMMKTPLLGSIIIYKEMNIFAKTFSSLLKNNVFITESIGILTNITSNEIYREIMIQTIENIAKGDKISDSFKNHWAVPDVAYYMIMTGESTGELADMMSKVGSYYQSNHKAIINSMKSFIEPAMIIFLAVIVGGIVMAVILPMFGLYNQIG